MEKKFGPMMQMAFVVDDFDAPIEYIFGTLIADYSVKAILYIKIFMSEKWMQSLTIKTNHH